MGAHWASSAWAIAVASSSRLVAPFNMTVVAHSPHAEPAQAAALGVRLTSLEELLRVSDFVSLHARLTADNRRLLGREYIALMRPTAYLINVARGELVDQAALVEALAAHRIAGAVSTCTSTNRCRPTTR